MSLAVKSGHPLSQDGLVSRRRLLARLDKRATAQVIALVAPAGYGKTALLVEWAARDPRSTAWLALEPWHDDPLALTRALIACVEEVEPFEAHLLRAIEEIDDSDMATRLLPALAGAFEARRRPLALILDDLHLLRCAPALQIVATVAEHLPAGSCLAFASRAHPNLPLGRLRAHRALLELDARELSMGEQEAASLLRIAGVPLQRREVSELLACTEGWPAALYLAALSLRDRPDPIAALADFSGHDEVVAEYLRDEFLSSLPARDHELLVGSSVCEILSGSLCDALLHTTGSARTLERLARSPLPFEAVDRGHECYRCHRLLREALHGELRRLPADWELSAHARARAWYASQGDFDGAIAHAIAAGEHHAAGELLWERLTDYIPVGRNDVLQAYLRRLSTEQIASTPTLAVAAAHSALSLGDLRQAEYWASVAAAFLSRPDAPPAPASVHAGIAVIRTAVAHNGVAPMGDEAARAHRREDEHSPWQSTFSLLLGVSAHLTGDRLSAREHLQEGVHRSIPTPSIEMLCLTQLALLTAEEGDVDRAVEEIAVAVAQIERHSLSAYPIAAFAFAVAADLRARAGRVDEARHDAYRAAHLLAQLGDFIPWYGAETRIALARAELRLADLPVARSLLAQASRLARRVPDATLLSVWLQEVWEMVDTSACSALSGPNALTVAELRILRFLPSHLAFREIADRLHVSINTVKTQAHAVYRKLGVSSRSQAVAKAAEIGLLDG